MGATPAGSNGFLETVGFTPGYSRFVPSGLSGNARMHSPGLPGSGSGELGTSPDALRFAGNRDPASRSQFPGGLDIDIERS